MDLNRVRSEEKLALCRRYFYGKLDLLTIVDRFKLFSIARLITTIPTISFKGGFACLPFLWLVNFFWFYPIAFRMNNVPNQSKIRNYVIWSGFGVLVWVVALVSWNIYFQLNRAQLSWGDDLSFVLPSGIP
jgi:presenilin enhancer 2